MLKITLAQLNPTVADIDGNVRRMVAAAHQVCPYSNAVRGNVDVAITVRAQ